MSPYDFVHLVLLAADGQIRGRTKLQKTVYFVGALTGQLDDLGYGPHYYGPYSADVAAAVEQLRGLGFLDQSIKTGGAVDPKGFEVARYDFTLTEAGRRIAESKSGEHPEQWAKIRDAVQALQSARADDYVKLSIAAKAYFLIGEKKGTATLAELLRLTGRFGWTVTKEQMTEAARLLEKFRLISLSPAT
jgi:uncharacterized protein